MAGRRGAVASLPERRRPRPRAPTLCPFVPSEPGVPSKLGSGVGAEARVAGGEARGRRARPVRGAPFGSGLGLGAPGRAGCSGRRAGLIVRQVRGRPAAGRAAEVGGGRAGGRRTPDASETSCRCFLFSLDKRPWDARGVPGDPRGPPRRSGRRRPGTRACERRVPCNLSVLLLPSPRGTSHLPRRRSAPRTPLTGPWRPSPGPAPRARARGAPGGGTGRGAPPREKGTDPETCGRGGELRGPLRCSRAAPRNAWSQGPGAGCRLSRLLSASARGPELGVESPPRAPALP